MLLFFIFVLFSPFGLVFADVTSPTVNITYSENPADAGEVSIFATYSEPITTVPTISINQPGSADISNAAMSGVTGYSWVSGSAMQSNQWESIAYGNGTFVAVSSGGSNRVATSPDGITWTARSASAANSWYDVTYGNGLFVAVANYGSVGTTVMTSPNGITWTNRTASEFSAWHGVTYGNNLFVAVSRDGKVMTSPNGITWTARSAPEANSWYDVTYGNGLFVAVSSDGTNRVMTSPDGITWTARSAGASTWNSVAYGNGIFVALVSAGTAFMKSTDGISWTTGTAASPLGYNVTYGGGVFLSVRYNSTTYYFSLDGVSWETWGGNVYGLWRHVVYGNGKFVAATSSGGATMYSAARLESYTYSYTITPADGSTYIDGTATVSLGATVDPAGNVSASPTNNTFTINTNGSPVAMTYSANPAPPGSMTITATYDEIPLSTPNISIDQPGSTDISSAAMTAPVFGSFTSRTASTSLSFEAIAYGNETFVVVTPFSGTAITSPDGITWTNRTGLATNNWSSIAYGNGTFVAVSEDGSNRVATSPDGITWTARSASYVAQWKSVTYGNGLFVAVTTGGTSDSKVMTSPDGITWTTRLGGADRAWYSVTYGNGTFVAVANATGNGNEQVMTSPDGISWTFRRGSENNQWNSVTYGNGLFVAVSFNGTNRVMTSPDGITWTARSATEANTWRRVVYGGGYFVAVSSDGTNRVMRSVDGISWSALSASAANQWRGIAYGNNVFVAISSSGTISDKIMTASWAGPKYTYSYTVNTANGSNYIDGTANVSLSTVTTDNFGNKSGTPSNNTFTIDSAGPTVALTYSASPAKAGAMTITATYSESVTSTPNISINQPGSTDITSQAMSGSGSVYTYNYTVVAANGSTYIDGTATVSLSSVVDGAGFSAEAPTNTTFIIDTTAPAGVITAICSVGGNGCTAGGATANPQEPYNVQTVSGTSSDTNGISGVEISIKDTDVSVNKWYSGSAFTATSENYLGATGTTSWTYDFSSITLVIDHIYTINIRITDNAQNTKIETVNFKFTNSPPTVSNVSASQDSNGVVNITYDVTDIESAQTTNDLFFSVGATLNGNINDTVDSLTVSSATFFPSSGTVIIDDEVITYASKSGDVLQSLTRGATSTTAVSHTSGATVYIKAESATGGGIGLSNVGSGKSISWTARTDVDGFETTSGYVKVVANDGSTGSMIGGALSPSFNLDAKKPSAVVTFMAGTAGVSNSAIVTIPLPSDQSTVEYLITDDNDTHSSPTNSGWVTITENTTIPWTFDSDIEAKVLKYQYRDAFGNTGAETTISTQAPILASSFLVQDATNLSIPTYDIYVGWAEADASGFGSYKIEYATSSDNSTFGSYSTISDASLSTYSTNYYLHRGLDTSLYYRYRLSVTGSNGNTSILAGAYTTARPDGVQNYGEGGGGTIPVAPKVENIVPTQGGDKNVSIDYLLTDSTLSSKASPSYEAYLFYNIGITLPDSALSGDSLTVSDASKLKSSGYVQINNEIIKYTSKSGNILSGLTRGTWPDLATSGRATRTNASLLSGTPVWVLASGTSPVAITNTTVSSGQTGTITWNTYNESTLAGSTYTNVGLRVLVHDNQAANSSPLSSQSDFSEIGTLATLDLTVPTIAFSSASSTGDESLDAINFGLVLGRAYPVDVTVDYALSGTATGGGVDYTLAAGTATITAGNTTVNISATIVNDTLGEPDETLIITLSNPANATLGANTAHTYTITDDDSASSIGFTSTFSSGLESVTSVNIPLTLSQAFGTDTTVDYAVTGGTATGGGVDYTLASGTATVTAGQTTTNISFTVVDDSIYEAGNETIIITLSNPYNSTLGANTTHTYTITDNDNASTVGFTSASSSGLEGTTSVNIPISISLASSQAITVDYAVTGGTATSGDDYTLASGTATIAPGAINTTFTLTIIDDATVEVNETIIITLSNPVNATISGNSTHTYTITNNDVGGAEEAPIITILGDNPMSINTGDVWTDPGATAVDALEGASLDVLVVGTVSTATGSTGNIITYFATDTIGNTATATRTVNVLDVTAPIISDISVPVTTQTAAVVVWTTNEPSTSQISFGLQPGELSRNTVLDSTLSVYHVVTLSSSTVDDVAVANTLTANTQYFYTVTSTDSSGNSSTSSENSFTSIPNVSSGGGRNVTIYTTNNPANDNTSKIVPDTTPPVISNIEVGDISAFQATVKFTTDEETLSFVEYGRTRNYEDNSANNNWSKEHKITLKGLRLGTTYNMIVVAVDKAGNSSASSNMEFKTKFLSEDIDERKQIENVQQFQDEIEATIESILPSLVPPFIEKPIISDLKENSVTITFRTNIKAYSKVRYASLKDYDTRKENPYMQEVSDTYEKKFLHNITLSGLDSNTKYHFLAEAFSLPQVVGKFEDLTFTTLASKVSGSVIGVKKDSFNVVWSTEEPTSSIIDYKNTKTGKTQRFIDETMNTTHSFIIQNLSPGTLYEVSVQGKNEKNNLVEGKGPINVRTSTDNTSPVITNLKVSSTLVSGKADKVQTIVSWQTDEPATSTIYYQEGSGAPKSELSNKQEDLNLKFNHVIILPSLKSGTVYRFAIESKDDANNISKPPVRTIITPRKTESVVDVIFKNFNDTFNFINNVR